MTKGRVTRGEDLQCGGKVYPTVEVGGFFKMAEGLVGKQVEKQIETEWAVLKKLLEAG